MLRQLVNGDENEIFALRSSDVVNKYLDRQPCKSIEDARTFIQTINEIVKKNDGIYWAITLNGNDKLIGTVCLFDFLEEKFKAEVGYELLPDFQGKGIMQEAVSKVLEFGLHHIGLKAIEAYTNSKNESSIKLLEKFNFKRHGNGDNNFIILKLTNGEEG